MAFMIHDPERNLLGKAVSVLQRYKDPLFKLLYVFHDVGIASQNPLRIPYVVSPIVHI